MSISGKACKTKIAPLLLFGVFFFLSGCTTFRGGDRLSQPVVETQKFEERDSLRNLNHVELLKKGTNYLRQGNLQLARLHFTVAVKKKPDFTEAYVGLGKVLDLERQYDNAEKAFNKALEIEPLNKTALIASGRMLHDRGSYKEAIKRLEQARVNYPRSPVVLTELAIAYDRAGREEKAEPLYRKVVALKPRDAAAFNNLGFNLLLQGKYQAAVYQLEKALSRQPENEIIRNNLASAHALCGDGKTAYELLVKTVGKAGAYNDIGYFYMTRKMLHKAEKALKQALREHPVFYARARANLDHLHKIQ